MLILDTNIISELMRPKPDIEVLDWATQRRSDEITTTSITLAELYFGLAILPQGARKRELMKRLGLLEAEIFPESLTFNAAAAMEYAALRADLRGEGLAISQSDAMIAAIARAHNASLVTRNVRDFERCGLDILNPFRG